MNHEALASRRWSTASFSDTTDTSPMELSAMREHMNVHPRTVMRELPAGTWQLGVGVDWHEAPLLDYAFRARGLDPDWGEALGRQFADAHGLSVICVRIGRVNAEGMARKRAPARASAR